MADSTNTQGTQGQAKITNINGKWIARCGDNIVAEDSTEAGLREQLEDLGIEVEG